MTAIPDAAAAAPLGPGDVVLAFDVGGTDTKSALIDADGRVLGLRRTPTPLDGERTAEAVVGRVADDADGRHAPAQSLDELEHLGRGARARERHDRVVAAVDEGLGCRERVGLAVPAGLAQPRVRLRDEPRRAAPDHRDAGARGGQQRLLVTEGRGARPRLGLGRQLGGHVRAWGGLRAGGRSGRRGIGAVGHGWFLRVRSARANSMIANDRSSCPAIIAVNACRRARSVFQLHIRSVTIRQPTLDGAATPPTSS